MSIFKSIKNLAEDVVDIALAPVEMTIDMTRAATKPIADLANEMKEDIKEMVDEDQNSKGELEK